MTKRKVLITLDNSSLSEQIVPVVKNLFSPQETELLLFSAVRPPQTPGLPVASAGEAAPLPLPPEAFAYRTPNEPVEGELSTEQALAQQREHEMQPLATSLKMEGFSVRVAAWVDEAADAIITYARGEKVDVIAMATHGRSGMSRLLLGSVAEAVVRQSHIPVLLLRPAAE